MSGNRWRPGRVLLAGLALAVGTGSAAWVHTGRAVTPPGAATPALAVTHLSPALRLRGEDVTLRYGIYCAGDSACKPAGTVYARAGVSGAFRAFPLQLDKSSPVGEWVAQLPASLRDAGELDYYAVLRDTVGGSMSTIPAGGIAAPQRSFLLDSPIIVALGMHTFGATRAADTRVATAAWGSGPGDVGLESNPEHTPIGASSFDIDPAGGVRILDEVHHRSLRFASGAVTATPLAIDGTIADMSVARDGSVYVLEPENASHAMPLLRSFDSAGRSQATTQLSDATAEAVRMTDAGPATLGYPSAQWSPASTGAGPKAHSAKPQPGLETSVGQVVVDRTQSELRVSLVDGSVVTRSWRITSATPLAEVQLAQPLDSGRLVVVLRTYTDNASEFVALVLGPAGVVKQLSLPANDWAETAPVSRFRLSGSSLFQLGSTSAGAFVDRYDLGVN